VWVNKDDLSKVVYDTHGGVSFNEARRIVDVMLGVVKQRLIRGEKVLISGFGCFRVVKRKDRRGVNPQTGEPILIRGRKAITFRPSRDLKSV
jgi:integration host factor subunit alpha